MNRVFLALVALFVTLNVMAPIAANKIVDVGIIFTAGSVLLGLAYGVLDVINDWRGRAAARDTLAAALWVRFLFFAVVIPMLLLLPGHAPAGYEAMLGNSARLFVAGWVSLLVGGWFVNTPTFSWLRARTRGRWFVLRYLTTSLPTIVIGTIFYAVLGFAGTQVDVAALIFGTTVARIAIGVVITPLVAALRAGIRYADRRSHATA